MTGVFPMVIFVKQFLVGVPSVKIVLLVMQLPSCLDSIHAFTVLTLNHRWEGVPQ